MNKMSILPSPGKISTDAHAAHWCTKRSVFTSTVCPQNSFDEFWRSAYKSYSMISVKTIKIILSFASSWLCENGSSALTEIKSKKRETSWNWRQNAGVLGNDGTSFQSYLFPKTGTLIALIFFKATLFCSKCAANFFLFLVRRKLKKFENHCSTVSLSCCPFLWFSCILPAIAYGSSSDNNPIYAGYKVNCQKQCSYRSSLGRRKMLSVTKQRKRENGETMSVAKWTSLKELSLQDSLLESL